MSRLRWPLPSRRMKRWNYRRKIPNSVREQYTNKVKADDRRKLHRDIDVNSISRFIDTLMADTLSDNGRYVRPQSIRDHWSCLSQVQWKVPQSSWLFNYLFGGANDPSLSQTTISLQPNYIVAIAMGQQKNITCRKTENCECTSEKYKYLNKKYFLVQKFKCLQNSFCLVEKKMTRIYKI